MTRQPLYWIGTAAGIRFDYDDPRPEMISLGDIIAHLRGEQRWAGNLRFPYSVLQHSIIVADAIPQAEWRVYGLLNSAAKAYLKDIPGPLKQWLVMQGVDVMGLERRILKAVFASFDLPFPTQEIAAAVELAADQTMATECRDVVNWMPRGWQPAARPLSRVIKFRHSEAVEDEFRDKFMNYLQLAKEAHPA